MTLVLIAVVSVAFVATVAQRWIALRDLRFRQWAGAGVAVDVQVLVLAARPG